MAKAGEGPGPAERFIISVISSFYFDKEFSWVSNDTYWEEVLAKAYRHGVAPLLYFAFKCDPKFAAPDWVVRHLKNEYIASFLQQARYQTELEKLLTHLEDKGVEVIPMKGTVLSRLIYPDPALRPYGDIDLLFKEKDWGVIRAFLLELGFTPGKDFEVLPPKLTDGVVFDHDLAFYRADGLEMELKLDPFDLGIGSSIINEIWDKSVVYDFGSFRCRSFSPEHQLLQLLIHLNRHGFKQIRWFIDIAFILKNEQKLDWELFARSARRDGIHAPVYFSLIYVCKLFDIRLSEEILNKLKPGYIKRMVWHLFWPERDIAAFNGLHEGVLVFPMKVFSKWFIPNILLTGRTVHKLGYFLRRVFPPSDFMERKYSNGIKRSYAYYMAKRYGSLFKLSSRTKTKA